MTPGSFSPRGRVILQLSSGRSGLAASHKIAGSTRKVGKRGVAIAVPPKRVNHNWLHTSPIIWWFWGSGSKEELGQKKKPRRLARACEGVGASWGRFQRQQAITAARRVLWPDCNARYSLYGNARKTGLGSYTDVCSSLAGLKGGYHGARSISTQGHHFQYRGRYCLDRVNHSLRPHQRPLHHHRVHAPLGGLFDPSRRQRTSRIVGKERPGSAPGSKKGSPGEGDRSGAMHHQE